MNGIFLNYVSHFWKLFLFFIQRYKEKWKWVDEFSFLFLKKKEIKI